MGSEPAQESKTNNKSFHKCNQVSKVLSISQVLGASTQGWSPGHSHRHEGTDKDQELPVLVQPGPGFIRTRLNGTTPTIKLQPAMFLTGRR